MVGISPTKHTASHAKRLLRTVLFVHWICAAGHADTSPYSIVLRFPPIKNPHFHQLFSPDPALDFLTRCT